MTVTNQTGVVRLQGEHFFQEMLRNDFKNVITETLRDPNTLLGKLMSASKTQHYGKVREWRTHKGRSTGNGATGMDGKLPDPGAQVYGKYFASFRSLRARILVDQLLSNVSRSQVAAWAESIGSEMTRLVDDNKYLMNRMLHGDGSGIVAEFGTNVAGNQWNLAMTPPAELTIEGSTYMPNYDPSMWLREGKSYVAITPDADPDLDEVSCVFSLTSIDSASTVTVSVAYGSINAGDLIVEVGSTDDDLTGETIAAGTGSGRRLRDTAYRREIMGIAGLASDADVPRAYSFEDEGMASTTGFQGIASATNPYNQGIVDDLASGSRPVTSMLLHRSIAQYHKKNLIKPDQALCSYEMANAIYQMLVSERIFVQNSQASPAFNGEIDNMNLRWGSLNFTPDKDCLPHRIYMWASKCVEWLAVREWEWMDKDGSIFSRLPDFEKYQATMVWDGNILTKLRREFMVITNLEEA